LDAKAIAAGVQKRQLAADGLPVQQAGLRTQYMGGGKGTGVGKEEISLSCVSLGVIDDASTGRSVRRPRSTT
jgi:hypothetical protein